MKLRDLQNTAEGFLSEMSDFPKGVWAQSPTLPWMTTLWKSRHGVPLSASLPLLLVYALTCPEITCSWGETGTRKSWNLRWRSHQSPLLPLWLHPHYITFAASLSSSQLTVTATLPRCLSSKMEIVVCLGETATLQHDFNSVFSRGLTPSLGFPF